MLPKRPAGHLVHEPSPVRAEYVEPVHTSQVVASVLGCALPGSQDSHDDEPVPAAKVPGWQAKHAAEAGSTAYLPAGHSEHAEAEPLEKVPGSQGWQVDAPGSPVK